ncbi:MAG: LptF/LptG family permease [Gemmatimonadetes bacterium]|nr:LptF/LptG family permease [Gemmatimonadota bacterium]
MKIVSRYVLQQHAIPFVFALSATTGIMLLNQIAKRFGDLVGKGLPWSVIVEVFALSVPFIVAMTLPMAVLVAVLYAFTRLSTDNELTALKANGVSLAQLLQPLLVASAGVAVVSFLFSDHVLPRSNHRLRSLLQDIARKKPTFALKEQVVNEVQRSRFFLRAGRIDQATFGLRDVTIYDMSDQEHGRIVYADSGLMAVSPNQQDLNLTLFDGVMHEFNRYDPKTFQQMHFRRDLIRVVGVTNALDRSETDTFKGDREMSVCEMDTVITAAHRDRIQSDRRAAALQTSDLRALVGLGPVVADTALPESRPPLYCRWLGRFGGFLVPADLNAQQGGRRDSTPEIIQHFNQPAKQVFVTGTMPAPRWGEVQGLRMRAGGAKVREANYLVESYKKQAIAAACIVFVLIGVPAALRFPRGGVGLVVGLSMVVFTIYYMGLIAGEALGNRSIIPPFWAMWGPDIVFSLVGLGWLWQIRQQGTRRA